MAAQCIKYNKQGHDKATNKWYGIIVSPSEEIYTSYADADADSDSNGLHMEATHQFLKASDDEAVPYPYSTYDVFWYEVYLSGTLVDRREDLSQRLDNACIPLAAVKDIVRLIFDHPSLSLDSVSLHVRIDTIYNDDDDAEEEDEDEEEDEGEEDLSRPTLASREAVKALEKVAIRAGVERETSCVVCLEGFLAGYKVTKMPCSHAFHGECIVRWLEYQYACPLCRYKLPCAEETLEDMDTSDYA